MPYTADKPKIARSSEELRQAIPGWGVDLDPAVRPGVPKENFAPATTGAHWYYPERQVPQRPRERSTEHKSLTPAFGTAQPLKGLSGVVRRYAYRYSEARAAHWLLLMLGDRIDVVESRITGVLRGRPDLLLTEAGLRTEITHHGVRSRVGQHRADLKHLPVDIVMFAGTGLAAAGAAYALTRWLTRSRTS